MILVMVMLTLGALALLALVLRVLSLRSLALVSALGMATLAGAYAGALAATSLGSHERVLARGEARRFCGVYLDCHLAVALVAAEPAAIPGGRPAGLVPVAVRVRVSSDARRATLALTEPHAVIIDDAGRTWRRDAAAERALGTAPDRDLAAPLRPGEAREVTMVFGLPPGVRRPRLLLREGTTVERFAEKLLIGDDDSFLHAPVTHRVDVAN